MTILIPILFVISMLSGGISLVAKILYTVRDAKQDKTISKISFWIFLASLLSALILSFVK